MGLLLARMERFCAKSYLLSPHKLGMIVLHLTLHEHVRGTFAMDPLHSYFKERSCLCLIFVT